MAMDAAPSSSTGRLEAQFLELRRDLANYARSLGAGDDAEDILQEVWLRIPVLPEPPRNARAYLFRMVYTALLDHQRGRRRSNLRDRHWMSQVDPEGRGELTSPDPEHLLMARQTLRQVEARLEALGEPAGVIFRRHRLEGRTQREVAVELGLSLSTIEKHLRRVYGALLDLRGGHEG